MIVEFQVHSPFLSETARDIPRTPFRLTQLNCTSGGCRAVVQFEEGDRERLDGTLRADDSVSGATHISTLPEGHIYSLDTDDHVLTTVGRGLVWASSVLEHAERTGEAWEIRARFSDKSTVLAFRDELLDNGVDIDIESIVEDSEAPTQFGITDPQREVLMLALQRGYFTVPRDASLSDLAGELGISSQAASERIRRGTRTLLENTLGTTDQQPVESSPW